MRREILGLTTSLDTCLFAPFNRRCPFSCSLLSTRCWNCECSWLGYLRTWLFGTVCSLFQYKFFHCTGTKYVILPHRAAPHLQVIQTVRKKAQHFYRVLCKLRASELAIGMAKGGRMVKFYFPLG